jgi:hypothetical protein
MFNRFLIEQYINEKSIEVGDNLISTFSKADIEYSNLANDIVTFLKSNEIDDNSPISKVDYKSGTKLIAHEDRLDRDGNKIINDVKIKTLLKQLGYPKEVKQYDIGKLSDFLNPKKRDNFKIFKGNDFYYVYDCKNYAEGEGYLNSSCMLGSAKRERVNLYISNPNVVTVLVLFDNNNQIVGRALLWKLTNGSTFMDRIYVSHDKYKSAFKVYAGSNGITTNNKKNMEVQLTIKGEYHPYPFMDTFVYYTPDTGVLSNISGEVMLQGDENEYNNLDLDLNLDDSDDDL